jgi:Icc protein
MPTDRSQPAVILQLTDVHLYADPEATYDGVKTRASFRAVLGHARASYASVAALVLTGDLADDGSPMAYRALRQCLQGLEVPVYCLPGNHDDPETMAKALVGGEIHGTGSGSVGVWRCIFLNTYVAGCEHGSLSDAELERLEAELGSHGGTPTVIFMHHHPVPIGSPWLDRMGLKNADRFFEVIDRHSQVRVVLWGHVHQAFRLRRRGVLLLGTPSTCVQFASKTDRYRRDDLAPGYRFLRLWPDGHLDTGVVRVHSGPAHPGPFY